MSSSKTKRSYLLPLLSLLFFLAVLPLGVLLVQKTQEYWSQAFGQTANIVVDTQDVIGFLPQTWLALAQGGEETTPMLSPVLSEIQELRPQYIRLDHLFDYYDVVSKDQGELTFNFTKLDQTVNDILAVGSRPLLALSYMPPSLSRDGSVTSPPNDWNDWAKVVQTTIEHYSGKNQRNLNNVYYEVWNEPDYFGNWQLGKDPDYLLLYRYASLGAKAAKNTNLFFLGGPATTHFQAKWVRSLFISGNRLDFISWHHYGQDKEGFTKEVQTFEDLLSDYPQFVDIKRLITEWGSDSENSPRHDSQFDAAHFVAITREYLGKVNLSFAFEIKDGPSPEGKKYWGRWGLLTHEKFGVEKKPKYQAFRFLSPMHGYWLTLTGEGTWVTGFATLEGQQTKLLLVNYDPRELHSENVPVTFINLGSSDYNYQESFLFGGTTKSVEKTANGQLQKSIFMPPNSVVLVTLEPI